MFTYSYRYWCCNVSRDAKIFNGYTLVGRVNDGVWKSILLFGNSRMRNGSEFDCYALFYLLEGKPFKYSFFVV